MIPAIIPDPKEALRLAAEKLVHSKNGQEAGAALDEIRDALKQSPAIDRDDFSASLRIALRERAMKDLQDTYADHSPWFPAHTATLLSALADLEGKYPDLESPYKTIFPKKLWDRLNKLSGCKTPKEVTVFLEGYEALLQRYPELRDLGHSRLLEAVKDELLAIYLEVYLCLPDRTGEAGHVLDLLAAVEEINHYTYPIELYYYDGGGFQVATPDTLVCENNPEGLQKKVRCLIAALENMPPYVLRTYAGWAKEAISDSLLQQLLDLTESGPPLPADVQFCYQRLKDLEDGILCDGESGWALGDSVMEEQLLAAQIALYGLGIHQNVKYLENDWREFLNRAGGCPAYEDLLKSRAREVLTTHILTVASYHSESTRTLLRLYLTLTLSECASRFDDHIRDWFPGIDKD